MNLDGRNRGDTQSDAIPGSHEEDQMGKSVVLAHASLENAPVELAVLEEAGLQVTSVFGMEKDQAREIMRGADAMFVSLQLMDSDDIAVLERCKIIGRMGTGVDNINVEAATAKGIWVTYVPDYSIDEVSSHAVALLLALQRNLVQHVEGARSGDWRYNPSPPIHRLHGKTLGLLGYGRIGRETGKKASGLGLRILAHDSYMPDDTIRSLGADPVDIDTIFREPDFLSVHLPLLDSTRHIVNADTLGQMKPTSFVINTARGEIVDLDALLQAVQSGTIAGAGIDVFPSEPLPTDSPLFEERKILITPHIGWASEDAKREVRERTAGEIVRVLQGQKPENPVNNIS